MTSFKIEAIAVKKETLKRYESLFSVSRLHFAKATTAKDSLTTLVLFAGRTSEKEEEKNRIFIHVTKEATTVYFFDSEECLFTRQIDIGSGAIRKEAEKQEASEEARTNLAGEVFRAIEYFRYENLDVDLEEVFLYGDGVDKIWDVIAGILEDYEIRTMADFIGHDEDMEDGAINDCAEAIGAAICL